MQLSEDISRKVAEALERPRWSSADPNILALLFQRDAEQNRRILRLGMWAAVLSYVGYGIFDWYLFPDVATRVVIARIVLGLVFLTAIEVGVRTGVSLPRLQLVAATALVLGATVWLLMAVDTAYQQELSHFIIFGTVFVLGANLFFNFKFFVSVISSAIIAVTFIYYIFASMDANFSVKLVIATFFLNCLVFSLYLSYRLSMERYWTFLHALQAKTQEQAAIANGEKLVEIANTDPLTGLRNRRAIAGDFTELYKQWMAQDSELGMILVDVDFFKKYNDSLGHQAGDDCLLQLANTFSETAALNDAVVGRYGGEEFIILVRVDGAEQLADITRQFCNAVELMAIPHPTRGDDRGVVTISAGATLTHKHKPADFRVLIQQADRALYASKFAGRATFTIYDPQEAAFSRSAENISSLLAVAVEQGLVSVVYQPIYRVDTGKLAGHETLMRLRDLDGSNISPDVFIPVAEQSGSINDLGRWVLECACRDMSEHGLGSVVSVNVSTVQLKAPDFALRVTEILGAYGISPSKLALEITESIDLVPEAHALRNINELRKLGVQIWLDDFGTGYAGLSWLRHINFDTVKIDRSFLHDCQSVQGMNMLEGLIKLLRSLGLTVLVEGVETEDQRALLKRLGVNLIQGFLLGRPEPIGTAPHEVRELRAAGVR